MNLPIPAHSGVTAESPQGHSERPKGRDGKLPPVGLSSGPRVHSPPSVTKILPCMFKMAVNQLLAFLGTTG